MSMRFSEDQINAFLLEKKRFSGDFLQQIQLKNKRGHKERELDIEGMDGSRFRIIFRQADLNPLAFSIILAVYPKESNQMFRLRRYNGKNHEHTNQIEKQTFYDFHIHLATERYQEIGMREDSYAEPTDRFTDFHSALECLLEDGGFDIPPRDQLPLFQGI